MLIMPGRSLIWVGSTWSISMKLLIADDHAVWRQGLRSLLQPSFHVIAEARDGLEAVAKSLAMRPEVVILDVRMPGMDGLAAAKQIKESLPETVIVMISAATDDQIISEATNVGVHAYLTKDSSPETMIEAIRNAAAGRAPLPTSLRRRTLGDNGELLQQRHNRSTSARTTFSDREIAVLRLMTRGQRYKEIACELKISPRTVGNYVASIYNKLGVNDRAEAVVYAIKRGLVRI